MSKLIVVCGLGGSGKTTTAKELSKKLNIVCFHKDKIKAAIYDVLELLTPKAFDLLCYFAEEQLNNNVDLIIEGKFNFKNDASIFLQWQKKYKVDLFFIICNAENNIRKNRILSRERHVSHKEADKKLLKQFETENFDYSIMPGKHIYITTDRPTMDIVNDIIIQLK